MKPKEHRRTWLSDHLQSQHSPALAVDLSRGFHVPGESTWSAYHDYLHRSPHAPIMELCAHFHPERTEDVDQLIWVAHNVAGIVLAAKSYEQAEALMRADDGERLSFEISSTTLVSDLCPPVYGGPTLLEALWAEMDRLMESLMTGQGAEGDKYRAESIGWVLAITTNGYRPDINGIRKEALRRFKEGIRP